MKFPRLVNKTSIRRVLSKLKKLTPEYVFLAVGLIAGLGFISLIPPLAAYDETEHFFRSYQLSDFNLFSDKTNAPNVIGVDKGSGYGGALPTSVVDVSNNIRWGIQTDPSSDKSFQSERLIESLSIPLERNLKKEVRFDNTTINSPAAYIPQSIGISLGKLFDLGPVYLIYLGRLANLTFWLVLLFFAIRVTPIGKWAFVAIALNPAFVFLAGTLSPDVVAGSMAALLIATVLYVSMKKVKISWNILLLIAGLSVLTALTKNIYLPLVLVLFIIPSSVLRLRWKLIITTIAVVLSIGWNFTVLPMTTGIPDYFHRQDHVGSNDQIDYITNNPTEFAEIVIWNTFGSPSVIASYNYVYAIADNIVPFWAIVLWLVCVVVAFLLPPKEKVVIRRWTKLLLLLIIIISALLTAMSLYIGWSPVGSKFMEGIQGRYLFPVSFLLVPLLTSTSFYITGNMKRVKKIMIFGFVIAIGVTLTVVGLRYWHGVIT